MKKLITAIALLTASAAGNAAIVSITESHQFYGDETPFRIMWDDIDRYGSIYVDNMFNEEFDIKPYFVGIDKNGNKTDVPQAYWTLYGELMLNDLYAAYDQQSSSSIPTEGIFMPDYENMIGMELTLPNPVFNDTRGMPYFLTEEQAANVADPSKVKEDCFNNICEFYYDVGYELTREDVISVGYNDYSVRYTYDDTQEESTNVPEPAPAALMGLALAGGFIARRKKK